MKILRSNLFGMFIDGEHRSVEARYLYFVLVGKSLNIRIDLTFVAFFDILRDSCHVDWNWNILRRTRSYESPD